MSSIFLNLFLLSFAFYLVEAQSQRIFPYVSFMGLRLSNHSYHLSRSLGQVDSVQCHTDLRTCCTPSQGPHRGDWYMPNGANMYESRAALRVDLLHNNSIPQSGIYRCDIPTNIVHDDADISVWERVYVGLYASGGMGYMVFLILFGYCRRCHSA